MCRRSKNSRCVSFYHLDTMSNRYIPHTDADIKKMLERVGVSSVDELYNEIPEEVIFKDDYEVPTSMSETELRKFFSSLAEKNKNRIVFAGQGAYDHYAPSVIPHLLSRSEFYTAYTPYQPEISQGTLQYIFEYQSMISDLTGMDCSNASMYDGATATAEAMFMMVASARKKNRVLLSPTLLPRVKDVVMTYAKFKEIEVTVLPEKEGVTDLSSISSELEKGDVAGIILPQPNCFGIIEDFSGVAELVHKAKGFLAINSDPSTLAVLRSPKEWGADIACGDGQSLGMPLMFGGPYLGYLACDQALIRKMPGRVVGATTDADGKRAFVLTLQAREQHIRREKATSNICSNQSLMCLYAVIYLSLLGAKGLAEVNEASSDGAHYLFDKLVASGKYLPAFPGKPFLKEFAVRPQIDYKTVKKRLDENGILGGVEYKDDILVIAVTEQRTKKEIDLLISLMTQD